MVEILECKELYFWLPVDLLQFERNSSWFGFSGRLQKTGEDFESVGTPISCTANPGRPLKYPIIRTLRGGCFCGLIPKPTSCQP